MKRLGAAIFFSLVTTAGFAQSGQEASLLWKISGNGLQRPSFLFGTIHMICKDDALLSDSLKNAIAAADEVYLEVDMDNMFEMLGAMKTLKMRDDTTLSDLLSKDDFQKVQDYFDKKGGMIPFSMIKSYKPMLIQSMLMEGAGACDESIAMEQIIMQEAKQQHKQIKGLETLAYQASIFDSIPYQLQADQLVKMLDSAGTTENMQEEYNKMMDAYKSQDLQQLDKLINSSEETNLPNFRPLLLDNRNKNWVKKLSTLMPNKSLVVAVGAGHLPGEQGVIKLLRKAGYRVTPVANKVNRFKEI